MQNPLMMALLFSKMAHPPAPQSNSTNSTNTTKSASSNTNNMLQMMMLMKGNSMGGSSSPLLQSMLGGMSSVSPWSAPSSRSLDTSTTTGSTSSSAASTNNALMMSLLTNMMANNNNGGGGRGGGGGGGGGKAGRRRNRQRAGKARQQVPMQMPMQMQAQGMRMGQGLQMQAPAGQVVMQQRSAPMAAAQGAAGSPASMLGLSQNDLQSTVAQLGGQAGIDAIYAQLGGKDAVMRMIQSGQGLPPGFQMPAAILNLGSKVNPGAATSAAGADSYDYEYYDPSTGAVLPPLTPQTYTQYPSVPPPSTRNIVPQQQSTVPQRSTASQQQSTVPSTPQDAKAAATGLINAVGGQQALTSVYDSLGGQAGIDAIYNSLGGRDAVMKMIQSGQGLPAGFQLPKQLVDLRSKLDSAAKAESGTPAGGGSYDYEYYYVDSNGNDISSPGASAVPPPAAAPSPARVSPTPARGSPTSARVSPTAAPMPSFAPPDQSLVAGGGSLFDFLDNEDNDDVTLPSQKAAATPSSPASAASAGKGKKATPSNANATLSDRLAAAQDRVIGGR